MRHANDYSRLLKIGERIAKINREASNKNMGSFKGDYDDEYVETAAGVEKYFISLGWTPPEK